MATKVLSKEDKEILKESLIGKNNPILVQVLGICSALAVTIKLKNSLVMGLSVTAILAMSELIISSLRNLIPSRIRIIVELVVVATFVIIVDNILKAFVYDVSKQLSVYVGLIITNCILLGRLEAWSLNHKPLSSLMDAIGNGLGYAWILVVVGLFREILGKGEILGIKVIPQFLYNLGYVENGLFVMPLVSFFFIGTIIWIYKSIHKDLITPQSN